MAANRFSDIKGLHHIALRVEDIEKSIKFFSEILGFEEKLSFRHPWDREVKKIALLDTGDNSYIEIYSDSSKEIDQGSKYIHIAFRTENVDFLIKRLKKAEIRIIQEPRDVHLNSKPPTDIRVAFIEGPEGEILEFYQSVSGA